jgi:maltooligosyltrehalose trehalohydrolase
VSVLVQLDWAELHEDGHARMLAWYRALIALRRGEFQLSDGRLDRVEVEFDEGAAWFVMRRGDVWTVVNFSDSSRWHVPLDADVTEVLLAWEPARTKPQRGGLHLPPQASAVVRVSG